MSHRRPASWCFGNVDPEGKPTHFDLFNLFADRLPGEGNFAASWEQPSVKTIDVGELVRLLAWARRSKRGTGLLNNVLYRGDLVWNRCSYIKDPRTGKRVARPNPPEKWETLSVPELRIVSDDLWAAVKTRQASLSAAYASSSGERKHQRSNPLNTSHRPRFLLSGLLRCGCCGGGFTIVAKDRYGCATRKQKGICHNNRTILRQEIDARVLDGLKDRLLEPELVGAFIEGFQAEMARARAAEKSARAQTEKKRIEIDRKIAGMVRAIEDGLYEPSMKTRMRDLEREKALLLAEASEEEDPDVQVLLHPSSLPSTSAILRI